VSQSVVISSYLPDGGALDLRLTQLLHALATTLKKAARCCYLDLDLDFDLGLGLGLVLHHRGPAWRSARVQALERARVWMRIA